MEILNAPADFAEQLRERRWTQRISTHRLADRAGVSAAAISQIENGRSTPTLRTAERIAAGPGASLEEFLQPRDAGFAPPPAIANHDREEPDARSNPEFHH